MRLSSKNGAKGAFIGNGRTKNGCDRYVRAKGHISKVEPRLANWFLIVGRIKHCWMDATAYSRWKGANIIQINILFSA
jgi:hypothetical protein